MPMSSAQQDAACDFLRRVVAGDVDGAFHRHVHPDFVHHNPSAAGDREGLRRAMLANEAALPGKSIDIRIVLEDGDRVCTASLVTAPGLIRELWDVGQLVPTDSPNENGPF